MRKNVNKIYYAAIILAILLVGSAKAQDSTNENDGRMVDLGGEKFPCFPPAPSALYADSITSTSAKLHVTLGNVSYPEKETFMGFFYKTSGTDVFTNACCSDPVKITKLLPGTTYEYYATSKCTNQNGSGSRASAHSFFTTLTTKTTSITSAIGLHIFPNPVSTSTNVSFELSQSDKVSITVYDLAGRLVKTIAEGQMLSGPHLVAWNVAGERITHGTYFLKIATKDFVETRKIIIVQ